jgi:hypothetical protein
MSQNLPINIKKVFLSFMQKWYTDQDPTFVWNVDPRLTQIFIGDSYIEAPEIIEKMPSIVVSRGDLSWAFTSIDQLVTQNLPMSVPSNSSPTGYMDPDKLRTDLIRCSITFLCISRNGIEAETIANRIFYNLVGYKDQLKHNGIHQILGISMGKEQLVRGDTVARLVSVPINVVFTIQSSIATTLDLYTITVLYDGDFAPYSEAGPYGNVYNSVFAYQISGNMLYFSEAPPIGSTLSVSYTGRYTLNKYVNITPSGLIDGFNSVYSLPEYVYTSYYVVSGFAIYASIDTRPPYFNYTYS